jgi:hypothetical protein
VCDGRGNITIGQVLNTNWTLMTARRTQAAGDADIAAGKASESVSFSGRPGAGGAGGTVSALWLSVLDRSYLSHRREWFRAAREMFRVERFSRGEPIRRRSKRSDGEGCTSICIPMCFNGSEIRFLVTAIQGSEKKHA